VKAMQYPVRLEHSSGTPIVVVRRRAPARQLSRVVPEACGTVWNGLKALGVKGAGRHVAVYRDCTDERIDMEIGVEHPGPFAGQGELIFSTTPAGEVATVTHFGPYHLLGGAHQAIRDWCAAHGRARVGPNWEVYGHWDPAWKADDARIRTDVYHLLVN
jgi:effector-binding domain-containing protein